MYSDLLRASETKKRKTENVYKMAKGTLKGAMRTQRECYNCDDGTFLDLGTELVCDTCSHSPSHRPRIKRVNPWEKFWEERQHYSGFTGPDRVRMVGGFVGGYIDSDGRLRI